MQSTLPESFKNLLAAFTPAFGKPTFRTFATLVGGWILCVGRRPISRVIQWCGAAGGEKSTSTFYRFFSKAAWVTDEVGRVLADLALQLVAGMDVTVIIDDSLCRKSGPHLWGAGMHHDPLRSAYTSSSEKGTKSFAFGHSFVIANLWVPLPWNRERGIAVPVAVRLYRSKKRCPESEYRKRTTLGASLVGLVRSWVPAERRLVVVADTEYSCREVVLGLPKGVEFIGPMSMKAAFFAPPPAPGGPGRPRKKGERLPSPAQLVADDSIPWQPRTLVLYGRRISVLTKTQVGLWYHVAGSRPVRMIVTRDPKGKIAERAYFTTDAEMLVDDVAQGFSRRWPAEVMHHDVKQHLGLEQPQNGWWRRPAGQRRSRNAPGPQPHAERGKLAAGRTVPFVLFTYSIVVLWYLQHGNPEVDVARVRRRSPWYRHKKTPSFADMLEAARRELWTQRVSANPDATEPLRNPEGSLMELLLAA
jgi:hypothetical protein